MSFELHPRLAADTHFACDWPLSRVLLMNDARYFWLVLVPRITTPSGLRSASADARGADGPVEFVDLTDPERVSLMDEAARAGRLIREAGAARLNIGALGNLVPQLHLHVVGRQPGDPAWPGPVWGHSPSVAYDQPARDARLALVRSR